MVGTTKVRACVLVAAVGFLFMAPVRSSAADPAETYDDIFRDGSPVVFKADIEDHERLDSVSLKIPNGSHSRITFFQDGEVVCRGEFHQHMAKYPGSEPEDFGRINYGGVLDDSAACPTAQSGSRRILEMKVLIRNDLNVAVVVFEESGKDFRLSLDRDGTRELAQNAQDPCNIADWLGTIADPMALIECDLGRAVDVLSQERLYSIMRATDASPFMKDGELGVRLAVDSSSDQIAPYEIVCTYGPDEAKLIQKDLYHMFFGRMRSFDDGRIELQCRAGTLDRFKEFYGIPPATRGNKN